MPASRSLLHLPIYAAACTGLYAGSLGLVTMLQAQHDVGAARDVAPVVDALGRAVADRRAAETAVRSASGALTNASNRYASAAALAGEVDAAMAAYARQVAELTGAVARLPTAIALPAAPGAVAHVSAPVTQATTGASGAP